MLSFGTYGQFETIQRRLACPLHKVEHHCKRFKPFFLQNFNGLVHHWIENQQNILAMLFSSKKEF